MSEQQYISASTQRPFSPPNSTHWVGAEVVSRTKSMPFCPKRGTLYSKITHFIRAEILCQRNKVSLLQSRGILSEQQSVSATKQRYFVEAAKYFCYKAEICCRSNKTLLRLRRDMLSVIIWLIQYYEILHPNVASTRLII